MPVTSSAGRCLLVALAILALASFNLSGCASTRDSASRPLAAPAIQGSLVARGAPASGPSADSRTARLIPVVREGRYILAELSPDAEQDDLMQQIVDVTIPATLTPTVAEALRYVLLRSGFTLCLSPEVHPLESLPLPAADLHLGPMTLEDALRILAGPAWKLKVDELTREVCFTPLSPTSPVGLTASFGPKAREKPLNRVNPMGSQPRHRP